MNEIEAGVWERRGGAWRTWCRPTTLEFLPLHVMDEYNKSDEAACEKDGVEYDED